MGKRGRNGKKGGEGAKGGGKGEKEGKGRREGEKGERKGSERERFYLSEVSLSLLDGHTTESHDGFPGVLVVNTEVSAASFAA